MTVCCLDCINQIKLLLALNFLLCPWAAVQFLVFSFLLCTWIIYLWNIMLSLIRDTVLEACTAWSIVLCWQQSVHLPNLRNHLLLPWFSKKKLVGSFPGRAGCHVDKRFIHLILWNTSQFCPVELTYFCFDLAGGINKCDKWVNSEGCFGSWESIWCHKISWPNCCLPESRRCICGEDHWAWRLVLVLLLVWDWKALSMAY